MPRTQPPLAPTVLALAFTGATGTVTGVAAAAPLWLLTRSTTSMGLPAWAYPAVCGLLVVVSAVVIGLKLSGAGRMVAAVFPLGMALGCAVPVLIAAAVAAL
ncbi:MAG: hypothetical protein WBA05_07130 [Gordonia sp. (in: high G+C Gram-positive bacteria)]|uniref:hypothetical protein n=1 Tax=Gordonia sp. (in: high G+C Gram-positive bacteria) TaxID=84139 RepID=UPI003C7555CC